MATSYGYRSRNLVINTTFIVLFLVIIISQQFRILNEILEIQPYCVLIISRETDEPLIKSFLGDEWVNLKKFIALSGHNPRVYNWREQKILFWKRFFYFANIESYRVENFKNLKPLALEFTKTWLNSLPRISIQC